MSNLRVCGRCGTSYSKDLRGCPNCGAVQKGVSLTVLFVITAAIIVAMIAYWTVFVNPTIM